MRTLGNLSTTLSRVDTSKNEIGYSEMKELAWVQKDLWDSQISPYLYFRTGLRIEKLFYAEGFLPFLQRLVPLAKKAGQELLALLLVHR